MPWLLLFFFFAIPSPSDLDYRLARWKPVHMAFNTVGLSLAERNAVDKLIAASNPLEAIFWQQADPQGLTLFETTRDPKIKRLIGINGGRYDLVDENSAFANAGTILPGRNFYPPGLTREFIEQYARQHPQEKFAIYGGHTVIRWDHDKLKAIPYRVEYRGHLEPAAALLREAAALVPDLAFAKFLRMRADALLSDDYLASDLAWVGLKNPKIDVIFGPNEVYLDKILGVKTVYEAAVLIRNDDESNKLDLYQQYIPDIQDALPVDPAYRPSKRGRVSPMEVMENPYRAGALRHGYQAVADNLPNDPRVHQAKGSKKVFFKNFMDARVNSVVLPLARLLMPAGQASKAGGDGYLTVVVMHEICHGLGPAYARVNGKEVDIHESIGPAASALEEAKADVAGMFGLAWLMDHGALPKARAEEFYASYVAGIFRTVRFGTAEPHGRAEMMEFNYLVEQKAIVEQANRYAIDYVRLPVAIRSLAKELIEQEGSGDRKRAEAWMNRFDKMPTGLKAALDSAKAVPIDIEAIYQAKGGG